MKYFRAFWRILFLVMYPIVFMFAMIHGWEGEWLNLGLDLTVIFVMFLWLNEEYKYYLVLEESYNSLRRLHDTAEELKKYTKPCCKNDYDNDGNCHIHK